MKRLKKKMLLLTPFAFLLLILGCESDAKKAAKRLDATIENLNKEIEYLELQNKTADILGDIRKVATKSELKIIYEANQKVRYAKDETERMDAQRSLNTYIFLLERKYDSSRPSSRQLQ